MIRSRAPRFREVLIPIWLSEPETARRARQRIGTVLDWACAKGFRATEAPMRSLSKGLPRQPKKDGHFAAMPYADVPEFVEKLRERESVGRLALETLILTPVQSGASKTRQHDWLGRCSTIPTRIARPGISSRRGYSAVRRCLWARRCSIWPTIPARSFPIRSGRTASSRTRQASGRRRRPLSRSNAEGYREAGWPGGDPPNRRDFPQLGA